MFPVIVPAVVVGLLAAVVMLIIAVVFGLITTVAAPTLALSGFVSGAAATVVDNYLGLTGKVQNFLAEKGLTL